MNEDTALDKLVHYAKNDLSEVKRQRLLELSYDEISHFPSFQDVEQKEEEKEEEKNKALLRHYFLSRDLLLVFIEEVDKKEIGNADKDPDNNIEEDSSKDEYDPFSVDNDGTLPLRTEEADERESNKTKYRESKSVDKEFLDIWSDKDIRALVKCFGIVECVLPYGQPKVFALFSDEFLKEISSDKIVELKNEIERTRRYLPHVPKDIFQELLGTWNCIIDIFRYTLKYYRAAFALQRETQLKALYDRAIGEGDIDTFLSNMKDIEQFFNSSIFLQKVCKQFFGRLSPLPKKVSIDVIQTAYNEFRSQFDNEIRHPIENLNKQVNTLKMEIRSQERQRTYKKHKRKHKKTDKELDDSISNKEEELENLITSRDEIIVEYMKKQKGKVRKFLREFSSAIPTKIIITNYAEDENGRMFYGFAYLEYIQYHADLQSKVEELSWFVPSVQAKKLPKQVLKTFYFAMPSSLGELRNPVLVPVEDVVPASGENTTKERKKLFYYLRKGFSEDDLRVLCFNLMFDFDLLGNSRKDIKCIKLIEYFEKTGGLARLIEEVKRERPHLDL